ncbi:hypothetical protein, partial [Streptomyces tricolor]|uniref:hypothetical protein n=1 Tax=Streptomyces tricolor TaxID=68277 RepID=UPI000A3D530E
MLLAILAIAALAPGLATAWTLRDRGWAIAVLAAVGITAALPLVLLASLLAFPPLGLIVSAASAVAALRGYDDGGCRA